MAITLTNSYQRISTIYLTYGEIRTYAKVNGQDRVNNYTGYNLKMTYYLSQWIETSRWSANLDGSTNSGNYTRFNAGETTIIETTRTINHYTDGTSPTKEISTSWSASFGGSGSAKVEIQMPKINRIATVISANNFNDEENPTVEFNNPAGFDIAPYLNFYDNNNNIILRVVREAGLYTSPYSWELTDEERTTIRNSLNFQKSYRVNIGVYTYSGETRLGYNSVEKTLSFVNAEPTFTKTLVETDTNVISVLGSSADKIVKNASKIKVAVDPIALKGATIKSVEIVHGNSDVVLTASPYELVLIALTDSFKVIVTDSRGYVVSETITKELIDYSPIEISQYSFKRVNPTSSDIKLNATIKYIQQTFDTTENTPTIQWKLGTDGELNTLSSDDYSIDTTNNEITITNLLLSDVIPYTQQGKLYLLVNDLLTSDAENQLVLVGIPVFDYGEYDLQVNGDLFIADRNRENPVNVLEKLNEANKMLVSLTKNPIGEFTLFEGSKLYTSNGSFQWLGEYYVPMTHLLKKFPLREGFTRKYKISMEYTDSISVAGAKMYLQLRQNETVLKEFLYDLTWGATDNGMRRYGELDFDINILPSTGHINMYVTPSFSAGTGIQFRIYRVYLRVYDVIEYESNE